MIAEDDEFVSREWNYSPRTALNDPAALTISPYPAHTCLQLCQDQRVLLGCQAVSFKQKICKLSTLRRPDLTLLTDSDSDTYELSNDHG